MVPLNTIYMNAKKKTNKAPTGHIHLTWAIFCLLFLTVGLIVGYKLREWKATGRNAYPAQCVNIVDGDTIDIAWIYGTNRLRVAGIDCPESKNSKKLRDQAKEYGIKSSTLLKIGKNSTEVATERLLNQAIVIAFPNKTIERDTFGRLLAYVEINGVDYGAFMLENGLAYPRPEPHPLKKRYFRLNDQAQEEGRGVYAWID